jgi:hypothetical protein
MFARTTSKHINTSKRSYTNNSMAMKIFFVLILIVPWPSFYILQSSTGTNWKVFSRLDGKYYIEFIWQQIVKIFMNPVYNVMEIW